MNNAQCSVDVALEEVIKNLTHLKEKDICQEALSIYREKYGIHFRNVRQMEKSLQDLKDAEAAAARYVRIFNSEIVHNVMEPVE